MKAIRTLSPFFAAVLTVVAIWMMMSTQDVSARQFAVQKLGADDGLLAAGSGNVIAGPGVVVGPPNSGQQTLLVNHSPFTASTVAVFVDNRGDTPVDFIFQSIGATGHTVAPGRQQTFVIDANTSQWVVRYSSQGGTEMRFLYSVRLL